MNNHTLETSLQAEEIAALQSRLLELLGEEILYYTGGKSSSVPAETAQSLFESMLYCIKAYLGTLPDPYATLKTVDVQQLFVQGLYLVRQYEEESRQLWEEAKKTRVDTDLMVYNHTLDDYFREFFKSYNPRFQAHIIPGMGFLDYPLYRDDTDATGILYIRSYLNELIKENKFCAQYGKNHIRALLFTHGAKHHLDYRIMLVNIMELLLEEEKQKRPKP